MTQEFVLELANRAIMTTLIISAPLLLAGLIVGLVISILQAVTQIHEMTLTFIPKILAIIFTLLLMLPWMIGKMVAFTTNLFTTIPSISN